MGEAIAGVLAIIFGAVIFLAFLAIVIFVIVSVLSLYGLIVIGGAIILVLLLFGEIITDILSKIKKKFLGWRRH
ncbi:hypothetical protein HY798_05010 [Candidatus Falkowbacteria bacterium]|nr:hypothetical protein [Candidatus Falkowbacteria bacterium]